MKQTSLAALLLCCALLGGCASGGAPARGEDPVPGGASAPGETGPGTETFRPAQMPAGEAALTLRIVDGAETGELILAGEGASEVYTLSVGDIPVWLDGGAAEAADLADGMVVDVGYNGLVLETWPAQLGEVSSLSAWSLGTERNPAGGYYDLCGLYLRVLEDLWEVDPGLSEGVTELGVDLSEAPGELTEGEKAAVAYAFGAKRGIMPILATWDELAEQGYLTAEELGKGKTLYSWENGCHFSITAHTEGHEGETHSLSTLFFDAEKHRGPLGAYFFYDCFAVWPEQGTWTDYTVKDEMIS